MLKISWLITDNIKDVSVEKFNVEWNGIYGYFEMDINTQVLGFCPDRELMIDEEGNEDILYWLSKLLDGIIQVNNKQEYEINLLSMNLAKIILKKEDKLVINFMSCITDEIIWSEEIIYQELYNEIICSIKKFIKEIQKNNSALLQADLIKKLIQENI